MMNTRTLDGWQGTRSYGGSYSTWVLVYRFIHSFMLPVKMSYAARLRQIYPFKSPSTSVDHIVVGGGVIGLAVAAGLVNTAGKGRTTFLVERRAQVGSGAKKGGGLID